MLPRILRLDVGGGQVLSPSLATAGPSAWVRPIGERPGRLTSSPGRHPACIPRPHSFRGIRRGAADALTCTYVPRRTAADARIRIRDAEVPGSNPGTPTTTGWSERRSDAAPLLRRSSPWRAWTWSAGVTGRS